LHSDNSYVFGLSNDLPLLEFSKKRVMQREYFVEGGLTLLLFPTILLGQANNRIKPKFMMRSLTLNALRVPQ
jgi:hypothetical protein